MKINERDGYLGKRGREQEKSPKEREREPEKSQRREEPETTERRRGKLETRNYTEEGGVLRRCGRGLRSRRRG